jgi:hypothetical protein
VIDKIDRPSIPDLADQSGYNAWYPVTASRAFSQTPIFGEKSTKEISGINFLLLAVYRNLPCLLRRVV